MTNHHTQDEMNLLIAESLPAVSDAAAYDELFSLGVTGDGVTGRHPLAALHVEPITPSGVDRFAFTRTLLDQRDASRAFVLGVLNERGELADIAAWRPGEAGARTLRGEACLLGGEILLAPRLEPLRVYPTVLAWLRADRRGVAILDDARAAAALDGVALAASHLLFARELRARLAPHSTRQPRILIPTAPDA